MSLHTDKRGRTWNVLEREDGSISVYYTRPGAGAHMVVYDSSDALQPSPAPAAWQPIATAPKDGTKVDLWFKDGNESYRFADARWIDGKWCTFDHETDLWEGIGELGDLAYTTHWQPLPAPPQADEVCECGGQGWVEIADAQVIDCPACCGDGKQQHFGYGAFDCPDCHGTGKAADEACGYCGKQESSHTRCEWCGYSECDKELHGDHDLCTGKTAEVTG